jgi:predicted nucleotidyltransferase
MCVALRLTGKRRTHRTGSDIDLVLVGEQCTLAELLQIENEFDDTFLPYTFDLSLLKHIENPELLAHIERVGVPLYRCMTLRSMLIRTLERK